jgi:hypothetical protein
MIRIHIHTDANMIRFSFDESNPARQSRLSPSGFWWKLKLDKMHCNHRGLLISNHLQKLMLSRWYVLREPYCLKLHVVVICMKGIRWWSKNTSRRLKFDLMLLLLMDHRFWIVLVVIIMICHVIIFIYWRNNKRALWIQEDILSILHLYNNTNITNITNY